MNEGMTDLWCCELLLVRCAPMAASVWRRACKARVGLMASRSFAWRRCWVFGLLVFGPGSLVLGTLRV